MADPRELQRQYEEDLAADVAAVANTPLDLATLRQLPAAELDETARRQLIHAALASPAAVWAMAGARAAGATDDTLVPDVLTRLTRGRGVSLATWMVGFVGPPRPTYWAHMQEEARQVRAYDLTANLLSILREDRPVHAVWAQAAQDLLQLGETGTWPS